MNYRLAYFEYYATGEGRTIEAEILCGETQEPTIAQEFKDLGEPLIYSLYKQNGELNNDFKLTFYETFGPTMFYIFMKIVNLKGFVELKTRIHFNVS